MELDERRQKILQLVVDVYIETAQPVSSAAVARRQRSQRISPATIRAVMADLESAGYLSQPHTSAGRIPTQAGLRAFVDGLVRPKLRPWDRTRLEAAATADAASFPGSLGQSLALLSGHVAVMVLPRFLGAYFREVGFARCGPGRFLAYFVSPSGLIQQKLVVVDFDLDADELLRIQNYLNESLTGRTLQEVHQMIQQQLADAQICCHVLRRNALEMGARALPELELDVLVEGATHLMDQPEFADVGRLRELLRVIEEKGALLQLLDSIIKTPGIKVVMGSEAHGDFADLALVGGVAGGSNVGRATITLLGPTRMDYGRLLPLVGYASELFGKFWEQL